MCDAGKSRERSGDSSTLESFNPRNGSKLGEAPMANASAVWAAIAGLVINWVWGFLTSRLDVLRC